MNRRKFLTQVASGALAGLFARRPVECLAGGLAQGKAYRSPQEAMDSEPEKLVYVTAIYTGTPTRQPDYLATVDADPKSRTYGRVIHRLPMPKLEDELHHFGWSACSSCHVPAERMRRYFVIPGFRSSRIYIVDTARPKEPSLVKVLEADEVVRKTKLTCPHTVHCLPDGRIMISMLGDEEGNGPGGFLLLDQDFQVLGRWEASVEGMQYNYDFWYQPRHNVMVSSAWAAPRTFRGGFRPEDVQAGRYGRKIHFWDWSKAELDQAIDLGEPGLIPLEVRFHHDPNSSHGFVAAALSSTLWHWFLDGGQWRVEKVLEIPPVELEGSSSPVPALVTDFVISMDDRFLYLSNWLQGDVRQYDITNPSRPKLTGQVWCGGLTGKKVVIRGKPLVGGPQMLQLSLDGKRLYVTNSLYSTWDNQFYPEIAQRGSYMIQLLCDPKNGGMELNEDFFVDFGQEPHGPARAHEMRFPGGDCTSDILV